MTWTCGACETVNGPNDPDCIVCGEAKGTAPPPEPPRAKAAPPPPEASRPRREPRPTRSPEPRRPEATPLPPPARGDRSNGRVAALTALVLLLLVAGIVVASSGGPSGSDAPSGASASPAAGGDDDGTTESADASSTRVFHRGAYTLALPRSWRSAEKDVAHEGYVESRWHPASNPDVTILVDHTRGYEGSPYDGAKGVQRQVRDAPSYRPIGWRRVTLGGREAWRWEFMLGGLHKVDYFLSGCGTGYALLGSASPARYARWEPTFERVARTLAPSC